MRPVEVLLSSRRRKRYQASVDERGEIHVAGLPDNVLYALFLRSTGQNLVGYRAELRAGEDTIDMVLEPGATRRGRIVGIEPDVLMASEFFMGVAGWGHDTSVKVDSKGRFTVACVPKGIWTLTLIRALERPYKETQLDINMADEVEFVIDLSGD